MFLIVATGSVVPEAFSQDLSTATPTVSCVGLDTQLTANEKALSQGQLTGVSEACKNEIDTHRTAYSNMVTQLKGICAQAVKADQSTNVSLMEASKNSQTAVDENSCKDLVFGQAKSAEANQNQIQQGAQTMNQLATTYDSQMKAWTDQLSKVGSACTSAQDSPAFQSYSATIQNYAAITRAEVEKVSTALAQNQVENKGMLTAAKKNIGTVAKACWDVAAAGGLAAILGPKLFKSLFGGDKANDSSDDDNKKEKKEKPPEMGPPPPEESHAEPVAVAENKPQEDLSKLVAGQVPVACEEEKSKGQEAYDKCVAENKQPLDEKTTTAEKESTTVGGANTVELGAPVSESQSDERVLSPSGRSSASVPSNTSSQIRSPSGRSVVNKKPVAAKPMLGACEEGSSKNRCDRNQKILRDPLLSR